MGCGAGASSCSLGGRDGMRPKPGGLGERATIGDSSQPNRRRMGGRILASRPRQRVRPPFEGVRVTMRRVAPGTCYECSYGSACVSARRVRTDSLLKVIGFDRWSATLVMTSHARRGTRAKERIASPGILQIHSEYEVSTFKQQARDYPNYCPFDATLEMVRRSGP